MVTINTNSEIYKTLSWVLAPLKKKAGVNNDGSLEWEKANRYILDLADKCEKNGWQIGIYIEDLNIGRTILKNTEKLFNIASLIKIGIMAACYNGMELAPNLFSIEEKADIEALIIKMIAKSDNSAYKSLVDIFKGKFNELYFQQYFKSIGLENTSFAWSNTRDISLLLKKIYKNLLFLNTNLSPKCLDLMKKQLYNNRIPAKLPGFFKNNIPHKTGTYSVFSPDKRSLGMACHDAGIIYTPKGDLLICIMIQCSIPCQNELKPDATDKEKYDYLCGKEQLFYPKASAVIQDISAYIYNTCYFIPQFTPVHGK